MRKDSYWREIVLTLAVKIFVLTLIWYAWFSNPVGDQLDDSKVAAQILSQSVKESDHGAVH
jgi:hypothetical protein